MKHEEIIKEVYDECIGKLNVQDVVTEDLEQYERAIKLFMEKALQLQEEKIWWRITKYFELCGRVRRVPILSELKQKIKGGLK